MPENIIATLNDGRSIAVNLNDDGTIPDKFLTDHPGIQNLDFCSCRERPIIVKEGQLSHLPKLESINFTKCKFLTLPKSLKDLGSLQLLILSQTELTELPYLPKELKEIILFNCKSLRIDDDLMEKIEDFECSADEHLLGKIEEFKKIQEVNGGAVAPATHPRDPQSSERSREALLS